MASLKILMPLCFFSGCIGIPVFLWKFFDEISKGQAPAYFELMVLELMSCFAVVFAYYVMKNVFEWFGSRK